MDMTHDIPQQLNKFVQKLDCRSVTLRLLNNSDPVFLHQSTVSTLLLPFNNAVYQKATIQYQMELWLRKGVEGSAGSALVSLLRH